MDLVKFYKYKTIGFIIVLLIVFVVFLFKKEDTLTIINETPNQGEVKDISIIKETIKEENFTGSTPLISGSSILAVKARGFVEETVEVFRAQANKDVPDMREKFGQDAGPASYSIDIEAKHLIATNTEAIVMSVYTYTGGAHGSSSYRVINSVKGEDKILTLADVIKEKDSFTRLVKDELNRWQVEGTIAVFPEDVQNLKFDSFENWAISGEDLIIYFDQYEVGPGALGAFAFPIPLQKLQDYLKPEYL